MRRMLVGRGLRCYTYLNDWYKGNINKMPIGLPMFLTQLKEFSEKSKEYIQYADLSSVTHSKLHSNNLLVLEYAAQYLWTLQSLSKSI